MSRVAQWKRAGSVNQRTVDRNHAVLIKKGFAPHDQQIEQKELDQPSRVAQWKRAEPITLRPVDRNPTMLIIIGQNLTEQSGAVEACWAHNPEVRVSKPRSASKLLFLPIDY
ncbi:hypothetical protein CDAR_398991 [Caerostris darwini]|uniref:Uncharacterized protein n=1 Tax=Caerostris darwini TaxID=1538125 RepID=A0AAV4QQM3_9ARAC|nr:hypothetical protein CDAR_398991 [Caerostris darwini]